MHMIGAVLVFFATRVCHWAFESSVIVWYMSPKNRSRYIKDFATLAKDSKVTDFSLMLKHHPETMSETFGDISTTEGQIVQATVQPAAAVLLLGGVLMNLGGDNVCSCALNACRGIAVPFGLMMVISTPVISGAGGNNRRIRTGIPVADFCYLYVIQWVLLHFVGFFVFVGPVLLIELPVAVHQLFWPPVPDLGEEWQPFAKRLWYCLVWLRIMCPLLVLVSFHHHLVTHVKNRNTERLKKWNAELCCGLLGSVVMYFNSISVFLLPGRGLHSWAETLMIMVMTAESLRIFFSSALWRLRLLLIWDKIDFSYECMLRTMAQGPVMSGLRNLTGSDLVFLHAVQGGRYDPTEWCVKASPVPVWVSNGATGVAQGQVRLLVVRPENFEDFEAFDFCDMHVPDLVLFCHDLAKVLRHLPTAETMHLPIGDVFKAGVRRPILFLSFAEYEAEIARIGGEKLKANWNIPMPGEDEVVYDVTEKILSQQAGVHCQRRRFLEVLESDDAGPQVLQLFGSLLKCHEPEPHRPDLGPHYEIQVRGLQTSKPTFALRCRRSQALPSGWTELPRLELQVKELEHPGEASPKSPKKRQ